MQRRERARSRAAPTSRERWTRVEARELLNEYRASGLSLAAFARSRHVRAQRLQWWSKQLAQPDRVAPAGPPRFLAVTLRPPAGDVSGGPSACVDIVLRGGRQVRLTGPFDLAMLSRLIETLEAIPC